MDKLWAPWRAKYVTTLIGKVKGCVFCRLLKEKQDKKNYIFFRSTHAFAVLNIYPYSNGHVLILPYRHVADLKNLSSAEKTDVWQLVEDVKDILDVAMAPGGYNIGLNLGRVAGAGFPGHLHIHIVPRWKGDVNFMPVVSNTKIISQSLNVIYRKLLQCAHAKKLKSSKTKSSRRMR